MTDQAHVHVTRIKHRDRYSDRRSLQSSCFDIVPQRNDRRIWQSQVGFSTNDLVEN